MSFKLLRQTRNKSCNGFTLIELMVSMVVGLIVLAAILTMYITMLSSNSDNLKSIRLNQDLRSLMSLITRDIRRAGANREAAADVTSDPPTNPFSIDGDSRFTIAANQQGDANACITYSYDSDEGDELYGFRINSAAGTVESRATGKECNENGWQTLSDPNLVNISQLLFVRLSPPISTEDGSITIQQITVTLTGQLRSDPTMTRTISEIVKIRNEEF